MPLYDVTKKPDRLITPSDIECSSYLSVLRREIHSATYNRIVKTGEEAVEKLVKSNFGKLVWTKTGALFGHDSLEPKKHVDHLWRTVANVMGEDKHCLLTVGTLLMWTIARRNEPWLLWREESNTVDVETGKPIRVSQYWIDQNYVPEMRKRYTPEDLCAKFSHV